MALGLSFSVAHGDSEEEHTVRLYQQLAPATVFLASAYASAHPRAIPPTTGVGAGFILDETGLVLTNAHVVDGASVITAILFDGQRVKADLVGMDPYTDIAVLRLAQAKGKLETVRLGDSDHLRVGQKTLVVGSPFGLGFTLSTGIISGLEPLPGMAGIKEFQVIQTTAPINPGNSGGPLVDSEGQVIGITTAVLVGAQNIGFAIPINVAKGVLAELKGKSRVSRPWLGIGGKFMTDEIRLLFALPLGQGLLIEDVEGGSPAAEAGLRAGALDVVVEGVPWRLGGDIIVSIQGQSVTLPQTFFQAMKSLRVGQTVHLEVLRNGERQRVTAVLRERPPGKPKPMDPLSGRTTGLHPSAFTQGQDSTGIMF
jgi:S1-C subfamily serine protease